MKADLNVLLSHTTPEGECLVWTRALNTDGYPRALVNGNANAKIHRVVWELVNGQSAKGLVVRHTCDNPKCINPSHLVIGTPTDNMKDRDFRERHGWAKVSHQDVGDIRAMYATGKYTQKEIGEKYNLSGRTISSMINRTHWKHVN